MFIQRFIRSFFVSSQKELDPSLGFTEVKPAGVWLIQKEYVLFTQRYYAMTSDEKTALIEGLCMTEKYTESIHAWVKEQPDSPLAHLLIGALYTYTAWIARSGLRAKYVTEEQFKLFFERLECAYDHLSRAIDLDPHDAEPFARMIRVLMGLNQSVDLVYSYFNAMLERDPTHLYGHLYLLNAVSHKWLGSDEEVMSFAEQVKQRAPVGSLLHTIIPMAHIELWLTLDYEEERNRYFMQKSVQESIYQAYHQWVIGNPENSPLEPVIHNYFCFAFYWMRDTKLAQYERNAMGQYMTFSPWGYEGILTIKEIDRYLKQPK
ncbi:DUF4034 domain-containing protein [Cytophagaceae bacterium YF14B1]|uniref:DUF4034 domain-containing protein n=1 Tax=Xanthocytophaga flava TaxID=3048013 RepID=A0AAE3UA02_9BACT|nr:DUF4034 domain-containing protein [Xanthocytophaga flavus]MDJ1485654.1 DUF4034 domain-containing protein [Xanthocytophaga flavus]